MEELRKNSEATQSKVVYRAIYANDYMNNMRVTPESYFDEKEYNIWFLNNKDDMEDDVREIINERYSVIKDKYLEDAVPQDVKGEERKWAKELYYESHILQVEQAVNDRLERDIQSDLNAARQTAEGEYNRIMDHFEQKRQMRKMESGLKSMFAIDAAQQLTGPKWNETDPQWQTEEEEKEWIKSQSKAFEKQADETYNKLMETKQKCTEMVNREIEPIKLKDSLINERNREHFIAKLVGIGDRENLDVGDMQYAAINIHIDGVPFYQYFGIELNSDNFADRFKERNNELYYNIDRILANDMPKNVPVISRMDNGLLRPCIIETANDRSLNDAIAKYNNISEDITDRYNSVKLYESKEFLKYEESLENTVLTGKNQRLPVPAIARDFIEEAPVDADGDRRKEIIEDVYREYIRQVRTVHLAESLNIDVDKVNMKDADLKEYMKTDWNETWSNAQIRNELKDEADKRLENEKRERERVIYDKILNSGDKPIQSIVIYENHIRDNKEFALINALTGKQLSWDSTKEEICAAARQIQLDGVSVYEKYKFDSLNDNTLHGTLNAVNKELSEGLSGILNGSKASRVPVITVLNENYKHAPVAILPPANTEHKNEILNYGKLSIDAIERYNKRDMDRAKQFFERETLANQPVRQININDLQSKSSIGGSSVTPANRTQPVKQTNTIERRGISRN